MRSIWGLFAVVAAATFYLYMLSAFLPPGPPRAQYHDPTADTGARAEDSSADEEKLRLSAEGVFMSRYCVSQSNTTHFKFPSVRPQLLSFSSGQRKHYTAQYTPSSCPQLAKGPLQR
ncbi:transmembrane protein 41A-B [Tachysurus ichikawai]